MARNIAAAATKLSAGPAERKRKSVKSPASAAHASVLDPDVVAVMTLNAKLERACSRNLRSLWRERGLSERGLFVLELVHAGLDRPSRLIEYFDVLPSTITFETEKLVAAGLLVRQSDPVDRRVVHLSLTDEGRVVHGETTTGLNGFLKPRLSRLAPGELQAFLATFRKILELGDVACPEGEGAAAEKATPKRGVKP